MPYAYNNTAQRWYDTTSGKFVAEATVTTEMRRHQEATYAVLDGVTRQLYMGHVSLEQWQITGAAELKDAHLAQAMFAVGGRRNMTQENYGRVGHTLRDQYQFLSNFAADIAAGNVSEAQAIARIEQYGNVSQSSYWREYALATPDDEVIWWDLNPGENCRASAGGMGCVDIAAGSPYTKDTIPTHPGAGDTTCRGNCNCTERREKRAA